MAVLASFAVAKANEYAPASLDLAGLIECKADVPTYNGFALWLGGQPDAPAQLGWKEIPAGNFFLKQYELPVPLHVLGRETASVVFTATGPMAVFDLAWRHPGDFRAGQIPGQKSRCQEHRGCR